MTCNLTNTCETNFLALPVELQCQIFKFCSTDILCLKQLLFVSHSFHDALKASGAIQMAIQLDLCSSCWTDSLDYVHLGGMIYNAHCTTSLFFSNLGKYINVSMGQAGFFSKTIVAGCGTYTISNQGMIQLQPDPIQTEKIWKEKPNGSKTETGDLPFIKILQYRADPKKSIKQKKKKLKKEKFEMTSGNTVCDDDEDEIVKEGNFFQRLLGSKKTTKPDKIKKNTNTKQLKPRHLKPGSGAVFLSKPRSGKIYGLISIENPEDENSNAITSEEFYTKVLAMTGFQRSKWMLEQLTANRKGLHSIMYFLASKTDQNIILPWCLNDTTGIDEKFIPSKPENVKFKRRSSLTLDPVITF